METFKKLGMNELNRISPEAFHKVTKLPFVIILDSIRSLNNVGSVFRTADAFRCEKLFLCGLTGQPPNREIHKTALGATESVKWEYEQSVAEVIIKLKSESYLVLAIEQTLGSISLPSYRFIQNKKYAFILGNEISGVSNEALSLVNGVIEIPQFGTKHSLNVSVTAGIISWEFFRQWA